jgi:hypothetical protein
MRGHQVVITPCYYAVLWIGIVLMPIRIQIFMLMPIRIGIKTMPILTRILSQFLHVLKNKNFFLFLVPALHCFNLLISVKWVIIFQYSFGKYEYIENLWKKDYFINFFICLELIPVRISRVRIGMPWMPIPILIRQNDADPTRSGSGSTSLVIKVELARLLFLFRNLILISMQLGVQLPVVGRTTSDNPCFADF